MNWIKKLFGINLGRAHEYHLGTTSDPRPFPTSGAALRLLQEQEALSPAAKLAIVQELMEDQDVCPYCEQVIDERPAIITPEQAMELLGFKKKE